MNIYLLFNSDIANLVLKTNGVGDAGMRVGVQWECRRPYFVIIVFWGALIVGALDSMGLGRMFIQGCAGEFKISLRDPGVDRFSLDLCRGV